MKKKLFVVFVGLVLVSMGLTPYNAQGQVKTLVKEIRQFLPISLGTMGDMTEVNQVDGNIEFTIQCNEEFVDIKTLQQQPDQLRQTMKQSMLAQKDDPNVKLLIDEFSKYNKGITYRFIGKNSGQSVKVSLTPDDLKEIKNTPSTVVDVEKLLEMNVQSSNTQCPMDIGNGLVWSKIAIEGNYVVYYYDVDEDYASIDLMKANEDLIHQSLIDELKASQDADVTLKTFIKLCKQSHKGIAYRYIGSTTGDTGTFYITADELELL